MQNSKDNLAIDGCYEGSNLRTIYTGLKKVSPSALDGAPLMYTAVILTRRLPTHDVSCSSCSSVLHVRPYTCLQAAADLRVLLHSNVGA
jgi:hypothetical protein